MVKVFLHELTRALGIFVCVGLVLECIKEGLVSNSFDLHLALVAFVPLLILDIFFILKKQENVGYNMVL
ncbi:MAG: hypothetical protein AB1352_04060 [Patescibacteria group bacterium]